MQGNVIHCNIMFQNPPPPHTIFPFLHRIMLIFTSFVIFFLKYCLLFFENEPCTEPGHQLTISFFHSLVILSLIYIVHSSGVT